MQIQNDILRRHMEEAAIEQLTTEYLAKGYSIAPPSQNGNRDADLVVTRGDEKIYFHVKFTPGSSESRERITRLHRYVNSQDNARLQMVVVRPPELPEIDVQDFEKQLYQLCVDRIDSLAVSELARAVVPEGVSGVDFDAVKITPDGIEVRGTALVEFEFDYGRHEDDSTSYDSYSLTFHLVLDRELTITEVKELKTDVSSFYE